MDIAYGEFAYKRGKSLKNKTTIDKSTPLMRQYNEIKEQYNDAIVLFRMGDFYETFNNDSVKSIAKH